MESVLVYDVLAAVIPHLSSRDALAYGTTCRFLRPIATRQAIASVQFISTTRLYHFCHYVVANPQERMSSVRSVTLLPECDMGQDPWFIVPCLEALVKLLQSCPNITSLSLPYADVFSLMVPTLAHAVCKLNKLTSLSLTAYGNMGIQCLTAAPNLQELAIEGVALITPLSLPHMPRLHTLSLSGIVSLAFLDDPSQTMPNLRDLRLSEVTLDLVELGRFTRSPKWWGSLRLRTDLRTLASFGVPPHVRALCLESTWDVEVQDDSQDLELTGLLMACSPQELSITLQTSQKERLWKVLVPLLPLRYLEVILDVPEADCASRGVLEWTNGLGEINSNSLFALAVHIRTPASYPTSQTGPAASDADLADMLTACVSRGTLPSLRFLAVHVGSALEDAVPHATFKGNNFTWWASEVRDGTLQWRLLPPHGGARLFDALHQADLADAEDRNRAFLASHI